jgi:iron complex transport system substrate-binding protein
MRIASLLPAASEIACAVGLADDLVAVTFECDHPAGLRERLPVVVDTALPPGLDPAGIDAWVRERAAAGLPQYVLDAAALGALAPDLILTQDLCRVCALPAGTVDDALAAIGCRAEVLSLDPRSFDEVLAAVTAVGHRGGTGDRADALVAALRARLAAVAAAVAGRPRPRVLVLEWTDPPFLAGHWVPELVTRAGGEPVGGGPGRSTSAAFADLPAADVVLVAPCGYGLADAVDQARAVAPRLAAVPGLRDARVVAIDSGALVVRAGPRLVDGVEALAGVLHAGAVPAPPPGRIAVVDG